MNNIRQQQATANDCGSVILAKHDSLSWNLLLLEVCPVTKKSFPTLTLSGKVWAE